MIAQRRPSYYLAQGRRDMEALTESHIRLLANAGLIAADLRDAALAQKLQYRDWQQEPNLRAVESDKDVYKRQLRVWLHSGHHRFRR